MDKTSAATTFNVYLNGKKFTDKKPYPISILTYKAPTNVNVISKSVEPNVEKGESIPEFPFGAIILDSSGSPQIIPEGEKNAITVKISSSGTAKVWFEYDSSSISINEDASARSKPIHTLHMSD